MGTAVKDPKSLDGLESKDQEDEIAMLGKGFHKMLRKKKFDFKKLRKGSSLKRNTGIKSLFDYGQSCHMVKITNL